MKKNLLLSIFLLLIISVQGQGIELTENEPAMIYSLPKSEICIEIELEKTSRKPGIYFQYSERYLATNQIALEEKTSFRLKSVALKTIAVADEKRTYVIQPVKKSALNQLSVNEKGILCGVNVPCKPLESSLTNKKSVFKNNEPVITNSLLPLGEEYMMAGSVAKLAEGAAKQIYRIRESRLSLLTGDLEHAPADGASMQAMLDGLNKSEKELTELFIGKTVTTTEKHSVIIHADSAINDAVAFRLSVHKGIVTTDDLSGNPYFVSIKPEKIKTSAPDPKAKKNDTQTINTIYPAKTTIELTDGVNVLCTVKTELPQFGVIVPLSADVFGTANLKVFVDPTNGRLLCIEK
jgi:hypothetical protein